VVLSGDGGDELFGGYRRYFWGERIWRGLRAVPVPARRALAAAFVQALPILPARPRHLIGRAVEALALSGPDAIYDRLITHWPEALVQGAVPDPLPEAPGFPLFAPRMQMRDTLAYLPDDILTKVDRASMTVGLEARVPLLDPRVFAFAWGLHPALRREKRVLRDVLRRHIPAPLADRPKMGFGAPVGAWLRGPLKDWADGLLHRSGLLEREPVQRVWDEHQSGRRDWQYRLWTVLMFEAWHQRWALTTSSSAPAVPDAIRGSATRPLETLR
jgi:asparagine synthase (glutamine-hydrolysing)